MKLNRHIDPSRPAAIVNALLASGESFRGNPKEVVDYAYEEEEEAWLNLKSGINPALHNYLYLYEEGDEEGAS